MFTHSRISTNYRGGGGHKNVIWWFWYQGVDEAPDICKACLASLRRWHPDKEIITLDKNNLQQWVTLPDYIDRKHEKGIISHTHYSDIVRLQLLIEHGGTWIDSTVLCTGRNYEYLMHLPLFFFRYSETDISVSNWFMVSDPGSHILQVIRDLHFAYWKKHNFLIHYFMYRKLANIAAELYKDELHNMPFVPHENAFALHRAIQNDEVYSEERMKYFEEVSSIHKLVWKTASLNETLPSSFMSHIIRSYLE